MSSERGHVGVQEGSGIVARFGPTVVVAAQAAGTDAFTETLLSLLEAAAPGAEIVWRVAELVVAHRNDAPAVGLLTADETGLRLFLHGAVRAVVDGVEASGHEAVTWVERTVAATAGSVAITLSSDGAVEPGPRSDLRSGLVPGAGMVFTPAGSQEQAPAEPPTRTAPAPQQPDAPRGPDAPRAEAPPLPAPPPAAAPSVNPRAGETLEITDVVSTLRSADGTRILLDRCYVFGREPELDRSVADGDASPIRLVDPEQLISRVQAFAYVDNTGVKLRDAHSANGTFVAAPGAPDWTRIGDEPAPLPVGWSVRMGRHVFTHVDIAG